ncbi:MAG: biotin/lipoyl-binding protein [Alistipes sp.]|nr:biotin/lipoyl-binding protein [Rikenellaceae bacterium]MBR1961970.1 biotin/lipoyl-binding protein [Alistipes sp.]
MKKYSLTINGNSYEVKIDDINEASTLAHVTVNGTKYDVEIAGGKAPVVKKPQVTAAPEATGLSVTPKTPIATKPAAAPVAAGGLKVACPLPGTVLSINVKEGDTVAAGQTLLVLEAMKMENNIDAERGGVVKQVLVQAGATVMEGDVLLVIE